MAGTEKLKLWQERLAASKKDWQDQMASMDGREALYKGSDSITPVVEGDDATTTPHVRNIVFENIESMVSSSIPMPKVTAKHQGQEREAAIIEHMLRNVMDELPMEQINDQMERIVPIQGGAFYLVEWDNTRRTHNTVGRIRITVIHPKQIRPQPGVYTSIEDMDWFILALPTTKGAVKREFDIDLETEGESEPEMRGAGATRSEFALTRYVGFERDEEGRYNKYSWINDTEIEDLDSYQARRVPVCRKCGHIQPLRGQIIQSAVEVEDSIYQPDQQTRNQVAGQAMAQRLADQEMGTAQSPATDPAGFGVPFVEETEEAETYDGGPCPFCGANEWTDEEEKFETVYFPIKRKDKEDIPGSHFGFNDEGEIGMVPTRLPFYSPDRYPLVMQRNVSMFGQLLGSSDVDAIKTQQNTINRMELKIIDRLLAAGTVITLPPVGGFSIDPEDHKKFYMQDASQMSMIRQIDFTGNLQYELNYLAQVYEEARQILGITNSFQGRPDGTAQSGVAKQIQAQQSAGRMVSKRTMKNAAFAEMYELIFKYYLAYADEPRPVMYIDEEGKAVYDEFSRYDFIEQDGDGIYYWNDEFLFSTDPGSTLATNQEAMWQQTQADFQAGTYGPPQDLETLVEYWKTMESLHYPNASSTRKRMEARLRKQEEMLQTQQQAELAQQVMGQGFGSASADPAAAMLPAELAPPEMMV